MARRLVPVELVAGGLGAACCPGRWCYLGEDEVHGLTFDPSVHGLPHVAVARSRVGYEFGDQWYYVCYVPECWDERSVDGAGAWARALDLALTHLAEQHARKF